MDIFLAASFADPKWLVVEKRKAAARHKHREPIRKRYLAARAQLVARMRADPDCKALDPVFATLFAGRNMPNTYTGDIIWSWYTDLAMAEMALLD